MNCYTGEITNDSEVMKLWREQGIPVLGLSEKEAEIYRTEPVVPSQSNEARQAKSERKSRLRQLMGNRR